MTDKKIVWLALYNPMIYESGFITLSVHESKKGAEMAIAFDKEERKKEWEKIYKDADYTPEFQFAEHESWKIKEMEIKP